MKVEQTCALHVPFWCASPSRVGRPPMEAMLKARGGRGNLGGQEGGWTWTWRSIWNKEWGMEQEVEEEAEQKMRP